jgi:hypothetical protein
LPFSKDVRSRDRRRALNRSPTACASSCTPGLGSGPPRKMDRHQVLLLPQSPATLRRIVIDGDLEPQPSEKPLDGVAVGGSLGYQHVQLAMQLTVIFVRDRWRVVLDLMPFSCVPVSLPFHLLITPPASGAHPESSRTAAMARSISSTVL